MREILFRGFQPCENGDKTVWVDGKAVKGRWVEGDLIHNYFKVDDICICVDRKWNKIKYVIPTTVGQDTGLIDKNGISIFEGDILLEKNTGYKAVVEWQQDTCRFLAIIINRNSVNSPNFFYVDKGNDRGCKMSSNEVIGTMWDKLKGLD